MNILSLFNKETDVKQFQAGQTIFERGDPANEMFIIKSGHVKVRVKDDDSELIIGPGELLGEMALIDDCPRSATAIAKTDCELIPVDEKRFTFLVQQTPNFSIHVMQLLVERLRRMNRIVTF